MGTISSRPAATRASQKHLKELAAPSVNILNWLATRITYRDDSQNSMSQAHKIIDEALDCMQLLNHIIAVAPTISQNELRFDVAIQVLENEPYIAFDVIFYIRP